MLLLQQKKVRGFTLIESVVVTALFAIMSLVVGESIASFYRLNGYTVAQAYQVSNAREGMNQLVQDLREMTFADNGTFPLAVMGDNIIGFYSDIDRDSSVEYIEYELSSTTLEKRIYNATGTPLTYGSIPDVAVAVSEYVQNEIQSIPTFVYYDGVGQLATATSTVTDIRYIQASIIVNIDPIRDPGEFLLRSSAALRNLKNTQ